MGRILAIDYGSKRSGLAETDDLQLIATGLTTVATPNLLRFIIEYEGQNELEQIVIGEPRQMDGSASEIEPEILEFISKLEAAMPKLTISRMDERFTSKMAFQSMIDSGLKKKQRRNKALVDEISATLILQDYLQSKTRKE